MALGALLDAGADPAAVGRALAALGVPGLRAEASRALRCGIDCARIEVRWDAGGGPHVHHDDHHPHRPYADIRRRLEEAPLRPGVRERAAAMFARLAAAEGRIHGRPALEVHFHEVGGEDALGDIVGVAAALEDLGIERLTCSPLPAGGGTVTAAHGVLPVPAPAVAVLLSGFELEPGPVAAELVTPTGAAIVAALATPARAWPAMTLRGTGWGAGKADFPGHPNACRFVWGETPGGPPETSGTGPLAGAAAETLVEIEAHLDDQSPEAVGHLYERLFAAGALDVATAPLWMKKQRPAVRLWVLARPEAAEAIAAEVFRESTTLGLRMREVRRWSLPRERVAVETPYGPVRVKVGRLGGRAVTAAPEYEDCRAAARASGAPLQAVLAAALAAWAARS
jgi:hypothetical protein